MVPNAWSQQNASGGPPKRKHETKLLLKRITDPYLKKENVKNGHAAPNRFCTNCPNVDVETCNEIICHMKKVGESSQ